MRLEEWEVRSIIRKQQKGKGKKITKINKDKE